MNKNKPINFDMVLPRTLLSFSLILDIVHLNNVSELSLSLPHIITERNQQQLDIYKYIYIYIYIYIKNRKLKKNQKNNHQKITNELRGKIKKKKEKKNKHSRR